MPDALIVRCACGWQTSGIEDAVVEATMAHGLRVHDMAATRDQVLAMAIPAVGPTLTPGSPGIAPMDADRPDVDRPDVDRPDADRRPTGGR